jgi:aspartate-semialdehyde dehydrogenase
MALEDFDFSRADIALFSPGSAVSKEFAPKAAAKGCVVIDNTSYFRMMDDIPLVVPEVNGHALKDFRKKNIIANPNCSTAQLVVVLKPLHDVAKIKRVVVSTYQSVSGAGKGAMDELYEQTKKTYFNEAPQPSVFEKKIAFNVIPQIDVFMEDGSTKEEWKMAVETQKILDPSIQLTATCVRVPVFIGHSEAVNIEFYNPITPEQARSILYDTVGISVIDHGDELTYITPLEWAGEDDVAVSRIRRDPTVPHGLNLWIVGDNLRKGAALNAIQIAEELMMNHGL